MEANKVNPTIKVQCEESTKPKPASAGSGGVRRRNDHLGLYRAASPLTTASNEGNNLFLTLPSGGSSRSRSGGGQRSLSAASLFNENGISNPMSDEKLLIKSFQVLANAIGFKKSFSTSDIVGIETSPSKPFLINRAHSDVQLSDIAPLFRLEASSRSLSTWVAVGDTSATTQLPSPQARLGSTSPSFTAADLIRSVNKRIRQTYLKKRLLTTYKALDRMSQMGFNLEKLKDVVNEGELASHPELVNLLSATALTSQMHKKDSATVQVEAATANISQLGVTSTSKKAPAASKAEATVASKKQSSSSSLSCKEIERDRGKPLSKYDRNVMIFDWLHTLDETASADLAST